MIRTTAITFIGSLLLAQAATAQNFLTNDGEVASLQLNTITTAVPFLLIAPDSRSGAMGDAGVAISPDANAIHWNPSKLAFVESDLELSLGYSPWLKALVPDINMAYLSGYKRIDDDQVIGASLRYFSLGDITFTDQTGGIIRTFNPNEFAIDVAYSRKLSERFSVGIAGRYVYSNLTGGTVLQGGADTKPGQSGAADISAFYTNDDVKLGNIDATFSAGVNISNIGSKMSYTSTADRDFIPTNLRIGPALTMNLDEYNKLTIATDINKLLVPTPPIYKEDSNGLPEYDSQGNLIIEAGRDPNVGVAAGMFGSFTDAPGFQEVDEDGNPIYDADGNVSIEKGSKFKEEMREFNIAVGLEYWYSGKFAIRAGYFHEHYTKGNRKYVTMGAGLEYSKFGIDFSYLLPTTQNHPLANTLRFTLRFNFNKTEGDDADS
jgi:hypothetical protein